MRKIGFLKVHVFPFSPRTGTPAATFPDQIPESVKAQRVKQMQTEADAVREELAKSMLGSTQSILLEKALSGSLFTGYTPLYLPVVVNAPGAQPGEILSCVLEEWDGDRCRARAATQ